MKFFFSLSFLLVTYYYSFSQSSRWLWAKEGICSALEANAEGNCVSVDKHGNSYATGSFQCISITFDSTTLWNASTGSDDIFIVKYRFDGKVIWAKRAGGAGSIDVGTGITVDKDDNIYLTGFYQSPTIRFGVFTLTNTSSNRGDIFVVKYDNLGNELWAKSIGGTGNEGSNCICTDINGNVFITGYSTSNSIIFPDTINNEGGVDILIIKLDPDGNVLWAKSAGGTAEERGISISTDSEGNSYITGSFQSPVIAFDSITLTNNNPGTSDFYIVKYDSYGNAQWAKSAGGALDECGNSIYVDADDNSYVAGNYNSPVCYFENESLLNVTTNAKPDIFIAKYNKSGNLLWINSANGISYDYCNGISADTSGNAYITGSFSSENMNFGPYSLTNSTIGHNFYIAKYGNFVNTNESYYINLYPNPATDILNIETNFITKQKFEILNILGQTIFSSEIVNKTAVNLGYLATGVYMVKVNLGKSILSRKFIKE